MSFPLPDVPVIHLPHVDYTHSAGYNPRIAAMQAVGTDNVAAALDSFATYSGTTGACRDVAMDIETQGTDHLRWWQITCVTAAFHTTLGMTSVLLNPLREHGHRGLLRRLLDLSGRVVFHNSPFDIPPLVAHRLFTLDDVNKVWDTMVLAKMIRTSDRAGRSLEDLSLRAKIIPDDGIKMAQVFSASGFSTTEQGYARLDLPSGTYRDGAMSDTVVTLRLLHHLEETVVTSLDAGSGSSGATLTRDGAVQLVRDIQRINQITLRRSARGFLTDPNFSEEWTRRNSDALLTAQRALENEGLEPGRGDKLIERLNDLGQLPANWPRTPGGALSADKKAMELLINSEHPLAKAHRFFADTTKVSGYLSKVNDQVQVTGRLHPMMGVLGASATGRMCLPTTHKMLSDRGILSVEDIRVGDKTIDQNGKWTTVTAVYRYEETDVDVWSNRSVTLECTSEHRWVTRQPWKSKTEVTPLDGRHRVVVLTPFESSFDPADPTFSVSTEKETFAALVGLLVSNGRCVEGKNPGEGMCAYVYPTEGGFYSESKRVIPEEAAMYDRVTASAKRGPHREIQLKTQWLRPRLDAAGLTVTTTLNRSESLITWAVGLSVEEAREFIKAVWLSDGSTTLTNTVGISVDSPELINALRIAAYKIGRRVTLTHVGTSEWGTKPRTVARLVSHPHPRTNTMVKSTARHAVWCVSTEDGTFTAWSDKNGPYLTGNSITGIELQQFPGNARGILLSDDDSGWSSVDWSSIEPVTMAVCAGDNSFLEPFYRGEDLYIPTARAAGLIPPDVSDEDAKEHKGRSAAKVILLAAMYGQGKTSLAASLSSALKTTVSLEDAAELRQKIQDAMPQTFGFMRSVADRAESTGTVSTIAGRVLNEDVGFTYKAVNHFCQGSAADVLYMATLAVDRAGLSDHIHLWMHDELVVSTEVETEINTIMQTPPHPLLNWARTNEVKLRTDAKAMGRAWKAV